MKELLQNSTSLGRLIQILEHFELEKEWTKILREDYHIILKEKPSNYTGGFMFLEEETGNKVANFFDALKERELMTRDETMILLSISSATLSRWQRDGTLQAYSIKSRVYFKFSEVIDSLVRLNKS